MSVISAPIAGCSDDGLLSRECRRRSIPEAGERASGQVAATALDGDQERRERLPVLGKGAVLAHRLACPLAVESDDEEQSARHGSALAADRGRAWNPIAKVALLRLPRRGTAGTACVGAAASAKRLPAPGSRSAVP